MKVKAYGRRLAFIVALCLLLTTTALASIVGQLIDGYEVYLGAGAELSRGVYWTGSDYRSENYIEYSPSSNVYPVVVSGSKVCNYGSFSNMAALMENQGKHVIAGINGDYYVMANSMPLGIVVEDGVLRSSDAGHWAVGFKDDGSTVFGKPYLGISMEINGQSYTVAAFNKTRNPGQAVVITDDFAPTTKNSTAGVDIICSIAGTPTVNSECSLTVEEVLESESAISIPAGKAIITVDKDAGEELLAAIETLAAGAEVKLKIDCQTGWEDVRYAIGSLYKLVTNGKAEAGLEAGAGPRTAVGMKSDGTMVFYTMDGRQTGHSVGVSMTQLAQRMIELGCVEATIMDGGGSTSLNAIYLGDSSVSQINSPSEGSQRSVTNYIMLVTDKEPTGVADRLAVYPLSTNILSGASASFQVKAADANGYQAGVPNSLSLTVSEGLGTITPDGRYLASGAGRGSVTAQAGTLIPAAANINVVESPDIVRVFREGQSEALGSLSLKTESVTALMAQAMDDYVYLISQDECYEWSVTGDIGTIDESGSFTAGTKAASGAIVVTAGATSLTIPVEVTPKERYDDVRAIDWFYEAVEYVSEHGLMTGTGERLFDPEGTMTRAMVVTVLHRMESEPVPAKTEGFSDVAPGDWYAKAVYWANERGIVEGDSGMFDPNGNVTREQLATILYRYYGSPAVTGGIGEGFSDADKVSGWAQSAMVWATTNGVITGTQDGDALALLPAGSATRAQVATILMRLNAEKK
jgi:hypothetical protein